MVNAKFSAGLAEEAREFVLRSKEGATIIFDILPGNPDNDLARQELRKLNGATIREFILPLGSGAMPVRFPLIRDGEGSYPRAQGLNEIRQFVGAVLDARENQ